MMSDFTPMAAPMAVVIETDFKSEGVTVVVTLSGQKADNIFSTSVATDSVLGI